MAFSLEPAEQVKRATQLAKHWEAMSMLFMPGDIRGQMLAECSRDLMQRLLPCPECGAWGVLGGEDTGMVCGQCQGSGWYDPANEPD